jgi:hypothetical protein
MHYNEIKERSGQLKSLVGLDKAVFEDLHSSFDATWLIYIKHFTLAGKVRTRDYRKRDDGVLPTSEDKLFFILHYLKANALQEHHAVFYGMYQSQANIWIHLLLRLLHQTLKSLHQLPSRNPLKIQELLQGVEKVYIDATEREIQRPSGFEKQQDAYSGKKRCMASRMPLLVLKRMG